MADKKRTTIAKRGATSAKHVNASRARKPTRRWVGAALPPEAADFFERYLALPGDLRAGVLADAAHALSLAEDRVYLAAAQRAENGEDDRDYA